jgi:hypothetical protein
LQSIAKIAMVQGLLRAGGKGNAAANQGLSPTSNVAVGAEQENV